MELHLFQKTLQIDAYRGTLSPNEGETRKMTRLFSYRDTQIYAHHSVDEHPDSDQYAIHSHEWMEILYCISGSGSYLVEGVQYPFVAGDIFLIRPGELHRLIIEPHVPYERIAIHFSPEAIASLNPDMTLLRPFTDRALGQHNRYTLADDKNGLLRSAFSDFSFKDVPNVRLNLLGRLLMFLTHLDGQFRLMQSIPAPEGQNELVAYVNRHLFEDISLQSVAESMHLSRSQVTRIFQQVTGTSMWKYVTFKRLLTARAMLQRGESANSAGVACGFSDYSSFYRAYRSYFGHSPREDAKKETMQR